MKQYIPIVFLILLVASQLQLLNIHRWPGCLAAIFALRKTLSFAGSRIVSGRIVSTLGNTPLFDQDDGATQRFEIYKDVQARLELDGAILRGRRKPGLGY